MLAETSWVLDSVYELRPQQIAKAIDPPEVVLRMGVELYYDLTEHGSRGHFIIADPATK